MIKKLSILLLCVFSWSMRASKNSFVYDAFEEDVKACNSRCLISGVDLVSGQCAITVAFNVLADIQHAYLIFETNVGGKIVLSGLHFGGTDCYFDYYQARCPNHYSREDIMHEDPIEVLKKCCRAWEKEMAPTESGGLVAKEVRAVGPIYKRYATFIVASTSSGRVWEALPRWREGSEKITFSLWGDAFFSANQNCCSFVSLCLRTAGIPVSIPYWWPRSPENLKHYVKKYISATKDKTGCFLSDEDKNK